MIDRDLVAQLAADLGGSLRFFSRLPVPALSTEDDPAALPRFARAAWAVPPAGMLLALPAALLAALLGFSALPSLASGALVVALSMAATGGLHEDGLADTGDGLAGGHDPERRLAIMKDSRIGVFGAAALGLALIARAALIGALVAAGPVLALTSIVAAAAVGRAAMVWVWSRLEAARPDGLSRMAGRPSPLAAAAAALAGGLAALLALPAGGVAGVLLGLVFAIAVMEVLARTARRTIGGQTGDILGAVQQVAEIGFLVGLLA